MTNSSLPIRDDFAAAHTEAAEIGNFRMDRLILFPKYWNRYRNRTRLRWRRVKFARQNTVRVPATSRGVYSFVAQPGIANHPATAYLLYIGMVAGTRADGDRNFRERFQEYLREPSLPKARQHIVDMFLKWPDHLWFYYAPVDNRSAIRTLENDLLVAYLPPHNRAWPAVIRRVMRSLFS